MKRYVNEAGSAEVRRWLATSAAATSRLSEIEVASALARRWRDGSLTRRERDRAVTAFRADIGALYVVELMPEIADASVRLLLRHTLRMGDAVQLASCTYLRTQLHEAVHLVAYDARLNEAAHLEGVPLVASV